MYFEWLGLEIGDVVSLQALSERELFNRFSKFISQLEDPVLPGGGAGRWLLSPVVDGTYLPADPFSPASPASHDVPLIIGTNKDEAALHLSNIAGIGDINEEQLVQRLRGVLGDRAEAVIRVHRQNRPEETRYGLLTAIASEDRRLLSIQTAEEKVKQGGAPVYMYLFTWESNQGLLKAAHTMEIPFVFHNLDTTRIVGSREDRYALANIMCDAWVSFARYGTPNHPSLPEWVPYDTAHRGTMIFDIPPKLEYDPRSEERQAWDDIPVKLPWEGDVFVTAMPD